MSRRQFGFFAVATLVSVAGALAHYLRAMLRIQKGETTDVEADLKELIQISPKNAYALYEYGVFLVHAGRHAEAVDAVAIISET